jgi:hypothetical protein
MMTCLIGLNHFLTKYMLGGFDTPSSFVEHLSNTRWKKTITHSPMNFFKTLAMVGLVGVGMVAIGLCTDSHGCFQPGGGGTVHIPPDGILSNQPTQLKITFSVWGAGSGRLDHRYTDVICLYRINESGDYHRISGVVIKADDKHMEMKFTIPPLDLKRGDTVDYQFEMLFDGHANSRPGGILKIK